MRVRGRSSRRSCERVEKIENALEPRFQAHLVEAMANPHNTAPYTQLRAAVELKATKAVVQSDARERRKRRARAASRASRAWVAGRGPARGQTFESGNEALRCCMKSISASSMAGSSGGAWYSASCFFHSTFARLAMSLAPSASHCS